MELLSRLESLDPALADPASVEFYRVAHQMREAVRAGELTWAQHPEFVSYAEVCFWAMRKLEYSFAAKAVARLEAERRTLRILDVGCGVVPFCNWLSRRGHEVTAIDPAADLIELLVSNNVNAFYGSNVTYEVARAEKLPFDDASFDVVTCVSVLEHVPPGNDLLGLRQIARVLKPGGPLVITFDVAPDRALQPGELPWPSEKRRYAQPFTPRAAERLLAALSSSFEVDASHVSPDLYALDWEAVHAFWRAAQQADGRQEAEREYVAMAGVLRRVMSSPPPILAKDIEVAYLEGQSALEERLAFFQTHADQRLQVVHRLQEQIDTLQEQLDAPPSSVEPEPDTEDVDLEGSSPLDSPDEENGQSTLSQRLHDARATFARHAQMLYGLNAATAEAGGPGEVGTALRLTQNATAFANLLDKVAQRGDSRLLGLDVPANLQRRLETLARERDSAEAVAEARRWVVEQQQFAIDLYHNTRLRSRIARRVASLTAPRIGVLEQYPPRTMAIPAWYRTSGALPSFPMISIVTATRNQGAFIARTLDSVLGQQYPALQYIVQDGQSTDETGSILERYRGSLWHTASERDSGFGEAINRGFQHADGEILAYLNSDDLLLPGALHYVADFFARHPEVDVVYGHRVVIDQHDGEIGRWVLPPHDDDVLSWADYVPQETMFWRRAIWDKSGGAIDESFRFAIDWDLLLRFREAGATMHRLPRFLGAFRVHPAQKTSADMAAIGQREMERLRMRALGRIVSDDEIGQALADYLRRHFVLHKLYRLGLVRY